MLVIWLAPRDCASSSINGVPDAAAGEMCGIDNLSLPVGWAKRVGLDYMLHITILRIVGNTTLWNRLCTWFQITSILSWEIEACVSWLCSVMLDDAMD